MILRRLGSFISALLLSISSLFVFAPNMTHALVDVCTWSGGGVADNFNDVANWGCVGGEATVPGDGDTLVFDSGSITVATTVNNDLTNLSLAGITFQGSNTDGADTFTVAGNGITLTGNVTNSTNFYQTFTAPLTLGANIAVGGLSTIKFGSASSSTVLALGTYNLALNTHAEVNYVLTGSGDITVAANKSLYLKNTTVDSSYSGDIATTSDSSVDIYNPARFGSLGSITMPDTTRLYLHFTNNTGAITFARPIILNGDGKPETFASFTSLIVVNGTNTGDISLNNVTFNANTTYNSTGTADQKTIITGTLNNFKMTRTEGSQGQLVVGGQAVDSAYSVTTLVSPGDDDTGPAYNSDVEDKRKIIHNNQDVVNLTVLKGGILGGKGKVGTITLQDGGKLSPGESPGCLSSGNLTFVAGSTYDFEVAGPTECTEYDQIKVTGTVTLGNGTLNTILFNGFKPVKDQAYKIIDNDSTDAVTGTFLNLAEGATFTVDGFVLKISYVGGDGNDVVLTVQSVPAVPDTGFKLLLNNPLLTIATTTTLAAAMLVVARKYALATTRK